jgi:hypothetical protein
MLNFKSIALAAALNAVDAGHITWLPLGDSITWVAINLVSSITRIVQHRCSHLPDPEVIQQVRSADRHRPAPPPPPVRWAPRAVGARCRHASHPRTRLHGLPSVDGAAHLPWYVFVSSSDHSCPSNILWSLPPPHPPPTTRRLALRSRSRSPAIMRIVHHFVHAAGAAATGFFHTLRTGVARKTRGRTGSPQRKRWKRLT